MDDEAFVRRDHMLAGGEKRPCIVQSRLAVEFHIVHPVKGTAGVGQPAIGPQTSKKTK